MSGAQVAIGDHHGTTDRLPDRLRCSAAGLCIAFYLYTTVTKVTIDDARVAEITAEIQSGAMQFLRAVYVRLAIFVVVVAGILFGLNSTGDAAEGAALKTTISFVVGAIASVLAGFSGMRAATAANGRTAMAAKQGGQPAALEVSYNGGAVMGLSVGGLGLLGISLIAFWLGSGDAIQYAAGFGMGASSTHSLVGGGIYTKAADVGADLVGKVEAGIPESPRNPASSLTTSRQRG